MSESIGTGRRDPIAVIGIGCRLPGANGRDALWRLLIEGRDAIREIPAERFDVDALFDERPATPGRIMTRWGGFLEGLDRFDAQFFGISPREADRLDPQQRLLLEVGWEALEDAGQPLQRLDGTHTGVFVGMWLNDYEARLIRDPRAIDFYMTTGSGRYSASGRLSYAFGFEGPSITIDCACSSSLVAVHLACRSLWSGESTLAIAGGSNVILEPYIHIAYSQSRMMAPDGRCKFGDARADGYVRSDGAAVVVLKPLSRAIADRDPIYATIIGSAVNNDGRSGGFMATPAQAGQETMLRRAYADAGVSPGACQYIEAHGTGTRAGDPVEVGAIGAVVGTDRPKDSPCRVGSVKTNIGHTEGAAGVSGLVKVALALKQGQIPASLHCQELNPNIPWDDLRVRVQRELEPWPTGEPVIAGVSSFGISGTNAHVVLRQWLPVSEDATAAVETRRPSIVALSAHSEAALKDLAGAWGSRLRDAEFGQALTDAAYTAATRRTHHEHRLTAVGHTAEDVAERLEAFLNGEARPGLVTGRAEERPRKVVFVFPGQGSQWLGMGRALAASEPIFAEALARCDAAVQALTGWSVIAELQAEATSSRLDRIDVVQPVLFSIQVALAALWRSWGIEPTAVVGHSMGEIAAAHVAGALSIEDAARIICRRSALLRRTSGKGAMAVVELSIDAAQSAIAGYEDRLSVAVSNSSRSTVLSGDPAALDELLPRLEAREVFCRRVKVDVASHSPQMDPLRADLLAAIEGIQPRPADVTFCSTVAAAPVEGSSLTPEYWTRNLREPVLFSATVRRLIEEGHDTFVEMSPHPLLVGAVHEMGSEAAAAIVSLPSGRREEDERSVILGSLGALHCGGLPIAWNSLYPHGRVVSLPAYPWQRERFWFDAPPVAEARHASGDLLGQALRPSLQPRTWYWEFELGLENAPYLSDHRVRSSVVVPAALFVELALEAARRALGENVQSLERLTVGAALIVPERGSRLVQIAVTSDGPERGSVRILSSDGDVASTASWTEHASAGVRALRPSGAVSPASPAAIQARCAITFDANAHYETMSRRGLQYGAAFRGVQSGWRSDDELLVRIAVAPRTNDADGQLQFRAAVLDACLQALVTAVPTDAAVGARDTFVPVSVESLDVHRLVRPGDDVWCHLTLSGRSPSGDTFAADFRLLDGAGATIGEARGALLRRIERERDAVVRESFYQLAWRPASRTAGVRGEAGDWLIVHGNETLASVIGAGITRLGGRVEIVPAAAAAASIAARGRRGVVYAAVSTASGSVAAASNEGLEVVRALAVVEPPATRMWFVTAGAQAVGPGDRVEGLDASTLWGLRSVVASEYPALKCSALDLSAAATTQEMDALVQELLGDGADEEVGFRAGSRYVRRLSRGLDNAASGTAPARPAAGRPYRAVTTSPGILDGLVFEEIARRPPAAHEVELEVVATGLNFMNVMSALGVLPGYAGGVGPLAIECAGRIVRVGSAVERFTPGDRVMAFAYDSLASHALADHRLVAPIPPDVDFDGAATIPIAFLTAHYALVHLARISRGERVLIHSATGGVGLAALQIARRAGAEIFATAGTTEKRELLQSLGVVHVADSRSLEFVEAFTAATNGEGVDVVLNSLAGGAIPAGLSLLRSGGRFLEIGKRDIYENRAVGLFPFHRNLSYFAIDLDRLARERPSALGGMFEELAAAFGPSGYTPLPVRAFPASEMPDAFRYMAQGAHTGKIVVAIDPESAPVRARSTAVPRDWSAGTYLITGGGGGLGVEVARWMADEGARRIVLMGRRGEDADLTARLQPLRDAGVTVHAARGDVARVEDVQAVIQEIDRAMAPLAGIVHAAGILDDGTIAQLNHEKFQRVLSPKVAGAWSLHEATAGRPLDFFVLFSSVTSFIGSSGQANYAAANAFLDSLAARRRASGLPALSINWGPWSEVGLAAQRSDRGARLAERGLDSLSPVVGTSALGELLRRNPVQASVMSFDAKKWSDALPAAAEWRLFAELRSEESSAAGSAPKTAGLRDALTGAPAGRRRRSVLESSVQQMVAQVLKLAPSRIDLNKPLRTLGLDSLMGLELRNRLEAATGVSLPATLVWNYPTVAQLAPQLAARMEIPLEEAAEPTPARPAAPDAGEAADAAAMETLLSEIEGLSEEDARRVLAEEL